MKTLIDFKSAREHNTTDVDLSNTIIRAYIDGKLFVSDSGQHNFDSREIAIENMINNSEWWRVISEYADGVQEFFGEDLSFKIDYLCKIWSNMLKTGYVTFKEFVCE